MNPTDQIAVEAPCCAHMKVVYERINHEGGLCSDSWKCQHCGTKFVPEPFIQSAIEKAHSIGYVDGRNAERACYDHPSHSRAAHASGNDLLHEATKMLANYSTYSEQDRAKFYAKVNRAAHASEAIICPYCKLEQETIGGFIAHLKLLHRAAHAGENLQTTENGGERA